MIHISCITPALRARGAFHDVRQAIAAVYAELEAEYGDHAPASLSLQYFAVTTPAGPVDTLTVERVS